MPAFSWDTVPRYMHVRKVTAFTPEEIAHLATFPLITFEKTTGVKEFGSTEQGTEMAAQAVKHLNPDTKILYYRNILVHYDCYQADKQLKRIKAPFLADQSGNTKLVRNRVPAYDLSNKKVAAWWLKNAQSVCSSKHIDGLFVDGNIKVLEKGYLRRQTGAEKKDAVTTVYHQMMSELRNTLGADALILSNIIRARLDDAGLKYLNYFDGSYIEGFEHAVKGIERKDYVAKGIAAIQKAARSGKMIAFTIGSKGYADTDMDEEGSKTQQKKTSSQDRFTYALALFLISAEKHSYFMFTDGFGIDGSANKDWMKQWPELSKPLGPPKGPAHQSGYLYRRSFQNAEVEVNIEDETATIHWIAPK
ncbi:putative glycoside hydrolase family 15 protein [Akkermansiaceae bacterium]|nr:putative glycoside hydrolase family 15 protein [Akkermansiaceae bacterium]